MEQNTYRWDRNLWRDSCAIQQAAQDVVSTNDETNILQPGREEPHALTARMQGAIKELDRGAIGPA